MKSHFEEGLCSDLRATPSCKDMAWKQRQGQLGPATQAQRRPARPVCALPARVMIAARGSNLQRTDLGVAGVVAGP